jgi:phage FluMu gp28-like protein
MLAEEAQLRHGQYRVEAVKFTAPVKLDLGMPVLAAFQDRQVRIPALPTIREDLHKTRKTTTLAGNVRLEASSDDAGHADRFWALALALHAGATATGPAAGELAAMHLGGGRARDEHQGTGDGYRRPNNSDDWHEPRSRTAALRSW